MSACVELVVVVDRIEEEVAVLEIAGVTVDIPAAPELHEGDVLHLCVVPPPARLGELVLNPPLPT